MNLTSVLALELAGRLDQVSVARRFQITNTEVSFRAHSRPCIVIDALFLHCETFRGPFVVGSTVLENACMSLTNLAPSDQQNRPRQACAMSRPVRRTFAVLLQRGSANWPSGRSFIDTGRCMAGNHRDRMLTQSCMGICTDRSERLSNFSREGGLS